MFISILLCILAIIIRWHLKSTLQGSSLTCPRLAGIELISGNDDIIRKSRSSRTVSLRLPSFLCPQSASDVSIRSCNIWWNRADMTCHWEDSDTAIQEMWSNVSYPIRHFGTRADLKDSIIFVCVAFAVRVLWSEIQLSKGRTKIMSW